MSWLSQLIEALRTLIRSIQMTIIVTPLILSAPVALYLTSYQEMWFDLLIRTIQACGPVYVKLGQWAATRRDLLPESVCRTLARLQTRVSPHSWRATERLLKEDFGKEFKDFYQRLWLEERRPVASGCCAQVNQRSHPNLFSAVM